MEKAPVSLFGQLLLPRCPHCNTAKPYLNRLFSTQTVTADHRERYWSIYSCSTCGGLVSAYSASADGLVEKYYPDSRTVDTNIPNRARAFLEQAIESIQAPSGSIMLCASAVDAMLKAKGYTEGHLSPRIEKAVADHLLTPEMGAWAHAVRLEAHAERHADEKEIDLPTQSDAIRCIDFVEALGEILFVLPARIEKGVKKKLPDSWEKTAG